MYLEQGTWGEGRGARCGGIGRGVQQRIAEEAERSFSSQRSALSQTSVSPLRSPRLCDKSLILWYLS
jgi:hypothetical protein